MISKNSSTFLLFALSVFSTAQVVNADDRPNMIVINVDELRWDGLSITGHPFAETPNIDRLAREGMLMENSFVTTPLCGPSRGCLMTGQYAHTNGSYKNQAPKGHTKLLKTYPMLFQKAGYKTAFIGKWTTGRNGDKTPHPGFDRWFCSGVNRDYKMDPVVNVDGALIPYKGHATDIDSAEAVRFIRENKGGPFNISLWHRSVHTSYGDEDLLSAERNRTLYQGQPIERRLSAQPGFVVQPSLKGFAQRPPTDEDIRNIARMTVDIDDGVGEIYRALEEEGILDKTMIIFIGDNGFFFGEHGLIEKRLAYLLPVFKGGQLEDPRSALLFEFWSETDLPGQSCWWKSVRTDEWKYVHYYKEPFYDELYDLKNDPYEMNNLIKEKKQAGVLKHMQSELKRLMDKYEDNGGNYHFWESDA
jgi:N-acetylglucosamine-6-sulfatase